MVPIVKGWSTELSIDVASTGVQVHGGMGFIEETGAAQHYRDARILTIYEGTTAIQANDLVGFAGLLVKSYELLKNNQNLLDYYQKKFCHILVDEFQDTNDTQVQLLKRSQN